MSLTMSDIAPSVPKSIIYKSKDSLNIFYVLFSQDLVGYVISSCNSSFEMSPIIDNLSQHYTSPFNDNVKNAINCILFYAHRKNRYPFLHLTEKDEAINVKYIKCAQKLDDNYFSNGFSSTNFLYFCVDIAVMSAAFHIKGMKDAPKMAVMCILNKLQGHDRRKFFALLDSVAEEFPCVSNISFNKALNRLKEDFQFSLSPLKEISNTLQSDESSGVSSGVESKLVIL